MFNVLRRVLGFEDGLCNRTRRAAEELSHVASELRSKVAIHERAPDPFASVLSTVWNNHEDRKLFPGGIDVGQGRVYRRAPT